ncbi:metallophosphoesterase [Desulfococcaceae bacterium HSG9]|nr:metallophosphoesterase [Desulfococcaceae bacterium HSG9]
MKMGFIIFFVVMISVIVGSSMYIRRRLIKRLRIPKPYRRILALVVLITPLTVPVNIIIRRLGVSGIIVDLLVWIGYLGFAFLSFILTYLIILDVVRLFSKIIVKILNRSDNEESSDQDIDPVRRQLLADVVNIGIISSAVLSTAYGVSEARRLPVVKEVRLPVQGLPDDCDGFRIAQISDIHVSETVKRDWVRMVVREVNRTSPDMVALTGDLADGSTSRLMAEAAPLSDLQAPYGKFFVTGNHEYYSGVFEWTEVVRRFGFTVLINEHRVIQKGSGQILIGGVTDYRAGRFIKSHTSSPQAAIADAPRTDFKILLAHQPKNIFEASRAGFDLQICGHTHGGQFFPWNYAIHLVYPFKAGLYKVNNTRMYVNRGTGYWGPPVRLGAPSEITLLILKKV